MKLNTASIYSERTSQARDTLLAALSGILMGLPFVNFRLWPLAWVALIPLLFAIRDKDHRKSFWLSYFAGAAFFGMVLHWLSSLVYWVGGIVLLGVVLLILYLALYWGLFGLVVSFARTRFRAPFWMTGAAVWILLEYVQSKLFTGFGWGLVGYSQMHNYRILQWACVGGVFLVSAIVVLSNLLIYSVIFEPRRAVRLTVTLLFIGLSFVLGSVLTRRNPSEKTLSVAVVQGNFGQDVFWSPGLSEQSILVHEQLSSQAAAIETPDLIIWSEAAVPGYLELEPRLEDEVKRYAKRKGVHLLLGAKRAVQTPDWQAFNSAYFISDEGEIADRYDKMHLCPFGEYLPLRRVLPLLAKIAPPLGDFSPGTRRTVFEVNGVKFGVLICFETVFPDLARALAREETGFLTTITNVAWYGRSAAAYQDLAICVFRAVENRMWLVRAANSGISCFIDPWGRIGSVVHQEGEPLFVKGWSVENVGTEKRFSLYTVLGDIVVLASGLWLAALVLVASRSGRKTVLGQVRRYGSPVGRS
jgi:apolipoprotein N-acyltransferase